MKVIITGCGGSYEAEARRPPSLPATTDVLRLKGLPKLVVTRTSNLKKVKINM